jgi:hypothetical protein
MSIVEQLEFTRDQTLGFHDLPPSELDRCYGPGKWSVRFLLHHLADSETVLYDRIRRVLCEPRQVLWVYDQEAWARGLDYPSLPLELSRAIYAAVRRAVIHYAGLHYESKGHLEFVHSVTGVRTLRQELDKVAGHNAHHLLQIQRALDQPPDPRLVEIARRES